MTQDDRFGQDFAAGMNLRLPGEPAEEREVPDVDRLDRTRRERAADEAHERAVYRGQQERVDEAQRGLDWVLADAAADAAAGALTHARRHLDASLRVRGSERSTLEGRARAAFRRGTEWREIERTLRTVSVKNEPPPYHRGGESSFFRDLALLSSVDQRAAEDARWRLNRAWRQVLRDDPARARRLARDATRRDEALRDVSLREYRAMTSGSTSGGAFVTPEYLVADYAKFREFVPVFAERGCTPRDLPPFGLEVNVPVWTGPADAAVQAGEGDTVTEIDPTSAYRTATISTLVSIVDASQALFDRMGPLGADEVLYNQVRQELDAQRNAVALNAALAVGTSRTSSHTALTAPNFLSDLGQAAAGLETAAGVKLPATVQFTHPGLGEFIQSGISDSAGRPVFLPVAGDTPAARANGYSGIAPGSVPLYLDGTIPGVGTGSGTQVIVTNPIATYLYASEPIFQAIPEPGAATLEVLIRAHQYVAVVVRYPAGVASISGAAYTVTPSWP